MKDSREHIINTAKNLFLQKGFKEVTMKELVESAGVSKGAFYHYFTSKEQVFEEVVLNFFNTIKIKDYDALSTTSLKDFYTNWVTNIFDPKIVQNPMTIDNAEFTQNHYYLLFDGLRLIPSYQKVFDQEQIKENNAWIKIVSVAKISGEIKSNLPNEDIAKLFMFMADGLSTNLLLQNKGININTEVLKAWDTVYSLLK
jgi:AcrR family transcriptional regulator